MEVPLSTARRVVSTIAGVLLLAVAGAALAVRYTPIPRHRVLLPVVVSPFLMPAAPLALVVLSWLRRWPLAGMAGCLTAVLVAIHLPRYLSAKPDPTGVRVRMMTINMRLGNADPRDLVRIADENADIVTVQELTSEAVRGLAAAGMVDTFPYQSLDAGEQAARVGVYSRYPITDSTRIGSYGFGLVNACVRVDGVGQDTSVASVHFAAPWPRPIARWRSGIAAFSKTLTELTAQSGAGPILVAGDFNSTIDMRPFRRLLTNGYRDAAEQAGAGRTFTYPSNRRFPPIIGIDHVLTRNCTAVSMRTVEIAGTDHRALLTTVILPRG
jgi:endonuclease/exonuclease/phosphatase (EEP) superfamily protein YafD